MSDQTFQARHRGAAGSRSSECGEGAPATIVGKSLGRYTVRTDDGGERRTCVVAGRLRKAQGGDHDGGFLAVGDAVRVDLPPAGGDGVIRTVLPRRNAFARRAAGRKARRQVIAANVDQVVAVVPVDAADRTGILDRFLVEAEAAEISAVVCVTKSDLAIGSSDEFALYATLGYRVVPTSAHIGDGLDALRAVLAGRTSVLVGMSGAGKSTLINALVPGLSLRTSDLSAAAGKGRHTTSSAEWIDLPAPLGGAVIDTPGVREFGLWDATGGAGDLAACFPEMRPLLGRCRFGDCTHAREPGCAIADAALRGGVDPRRRRSYLRMLGAEAAEAHTSHDADSQRSAAIDAERAARAQAGAFRCANCAQPVPAGGDGGRGAPGSNHRNHCPRCLHSVHVDVRPGDRAAACGAVMEPITVWVRRGGEWALIHRCTSCGTLHSNRVAGDDNELALVAMAVKPLANFPFPVDRLAAAPRAE